MKCVVSCPSVGYFSNFIALRCDPCDISCHTCNNQTASNCTSCSGTKFLDSNNCNTICSVGKYPNLTTNTCDLCDPSCYTCSSSTKNSCLSCNSNTFLLSNTCITTCPSHSYGDKIL